ncbi:Mitotic checkpoint serine/threonine-protein kinase BUB1 [Oopsacas minuta]|uniref:Mitotic checkpoint serine/threonine-protein kinase BUB1 n=1 Tax=Oopsacas minuta TaxID=111878 RepID=A0AAV7JD53_9METZ|nr:Mitotic checkpoint serine/threonine-protein kinase BUB1 [Oopsacas minuta]
MSWDQSKENIQPHRQGRKVEALFRTGESQSKNSQRKKILLDNISSALEYEDPLQPYIEYINWYREVNSNLGSEYYKFLENCVLFFKRNNLTQKYDSDTRFIRVWVSYAEGFKDPQIIYEYMRSHGIGTSLATFYEFWSRSLETKGNNTEAKAVICNGISLLAQPIGRLEGLLVELQDRIDKSVEHPDQQSDGRNVLGNLTSHEGKVDSMRTSSYQKPVQPIGEQQTSSNRQTEFSVYSGQADNLTQLPHYSNTALPTREKLSQENTQPLSKWIKSSIPITPDCRQATPVDFIIHPDPEVPLSVPAMTGIPKGTLKLRLQTPEPGPLHVLDERSSARYPEPNQVLMYPYWEVYPYGTVEDISVEELRAKRYMKEHEIDSDDMEFTCMDRANVILSPNWSIPNHKQTHVAVRGVGRSPGGYEHAKVKKTLSGPDHDIKEPNNSTTSAVPRRNIGPVIHTPIHPYRIPESTQSPQIYTSKYLSGNPSLSRSRSFDETIANVSNTTKLQGKSHYIGAVRSQQREASNNSKDNSSICNPITYPTEIQSSHVADKLTPRSIPPPPSPTQQLIPTHRVLSDGIEDTSMSRKADAVILDLFATTLPSEKEDIGDHIEKIKIKEDVKLHIFESDNKQSDISLMPPPSRTLTYRTPAKNYSTKSSDTFIDSSLFLQQPTSTPMGARIVPLSMDDVTQIPIQDTMSHLDPVALRFGQLNCDENKENIVSSSKETSSTLGEQRVEGERIRQQLQLSSIKETSQENSSGKSTSSMEEAVTLIYPFDLLTIRQMINEYKKQSNYPRLINYTNLPVPNIGVKRTCQFGNIHFKILEHVGTGGFANVYLASPQTPEAQKLTHTDRPVLKVVMKQPTCIEYLISSKIQEKLTELKQPHLCSSFYQPYSCLIYKNATIIVSEYYSHGTLLDMINQMKVKRGINDSITVQFALEVMYLVGTLHSIGIVHNDIKPDNFMLRSNDQIANMREPEGRLLHLIDFGRSVDLSLFPKNVQFLGSSDTDTFELPCMKTNKPYLYNCDSFSVAATLYCLITYEYPKIIPESDGSNRVKLVRPIKSARRDYPPIWDSLIYKLMNASSYEAMGAITEGRKEIKEHYQNGNEYATY